MVERAFGVFDAKPEKLLVRIVRASSQESLFSVHKLSVLALQAFVAKERKLPRWLDYAIDNVIYG